MSILPIDLAQAPQIQFTEQASIPPALPPRPLTPHPSAARETSAADINARSPSTATTLVGNYDDEPTWPSGFRPWLCLFGCFLLMFNSWGLVNAYGTFQSYYLQHLIPNANQLQLNLVGSTQSFVVLLLSFVVGRVLDAGHARQLVAYGGLLITLGMFLLSATGGQGRGQGRYGLIWLTQGFIVGLGMSCFFVSSSQSEFVLPPSALRLDANDRMVAATYFVKRKAIAIGIVASGASIGRHETICLRVYHFTHMPSLAGLIYPMMIKFLITQVGYNDAVRYVATLVGVTSLAAFLLAVPNPAHRYRKPETWRSLRVWIDTNAFRDPAFCWFTASICFVFFGFYAVFFNLEDVSHLDSSSFADRSVR